MTRKKPPHEFSFTCGCMDCRTAVRKFEDELAESMRELHEKPEFLTCGELLAAWREQVAEWHKHQFRWGCEPDHDARSRAWWKQHGDAVELRLIRLGALLYRVGFTPDFVTAERQRVLADLSAT